MMTGIPLPFLFGGDSKSTDDDDTERKTNISFYPYFCVYFFLLVFT